MVIYSPADGEIVPLEKAPDPVFAEKMLGDGIAIEPSGKKAVVCAPISGTVKTLNKNLHAVLLENPEGVEVLLHIGIDTVELKGKGFKAKTKAGAKVNRGDPLIVADLNFIRKKAPSALIMVLLTNRPEAKLKVLATGTVEKGAKMLEASDGSDAQEDDLSGNLQSSPWLEIINPNGLHARPAAVLAREAAKLPGKIELEKEGGFKADAKSATAIMGAALDKGVKIRFWSQNAELLSPLIEAVQSGLGEGGGAAANPAASLSEERLGENTQNVSFDSECAVTAHAAAPGIAIGPVFLLTQTERQVAETASANYEQEKNTLNKAIANAKAAIEVDMRHADEEAQDILEAHLTFLSDPALFEQADAFLKEGKSGAFAWQTATRQAAETLAASNNAYMRARAADMRDVGKRVLNSLLGKEAAVNYPEGCIIIAQELLPSDVSSFAAKAAGAITVQGSATAHVSIMMRNKGVPALFDAPRALLNAPSGSKVIIDADGQKFILNPTAKTVADYTKKIETMAKDRKEALAAAEEASFTKDGRRIEVSGNVSGYVEGVEAIERGAEGFGLVRSEFLFHDRTSAPSEEEQIELYQNLLDCSKNYLVTVRLLDAGGDKPISYVKADKEDNPLLGMRGVRLFIDNEDLLRTQLRALLRCKPLKRLKIMIPMVSLASEIERVRLIMEEEMAKLSISEAPQLGAMAETPSVCVMSEQFAKHVQFFSVGSNDLTQYAMAMDRTSPRLASMSSALHPSVLHMIKLLCQGAQKFKRPVAVCGAAASEPLSALIFVGLGVTELAASGVAVPQIKALIRRYSLKRLQACAEKALAAEDANGVKALVNAELGISI